MKLKVTVIKSVAKTLGLAATAASVRTSTPRPTRRIRLSPTEVLWSFPGNCQGQSLRIQRHLTYGGSCYRN